MRKSGDYNKCLENLFVFIITRISGALRARLKFKPLRGAFFTHMKKMGAIWAGS